ncbi:hypothetical protein NE398_10090 [Clostridium tertium]|uniref:HipA-like kinase domain-containing protein n=1 Tax=Clostridium tertium TaxID=1559 RepID=A0A9X3XL67_9CLOT|nr:HipA family kinase [Clostridium tertium]MDC4240511.1 hypothetical protein [Clostridium tertium]
MDNVTKLLERLEASTDPFEAKINDRYVYIKTFGCRWSNKILINEYICLEIAKALKLPIPNGGFCLVNDETDITDVIDDIGYDENINGVAFYSEKIHNVNPSIKSINVVNNIVNKDEINSIILFDHLVYNIDRHKGNLLINYGGGINGFKMYIIDHSHVFNLQHNWNVQGLQKLIISDDYKDKIILDLNYKEVYKYFYELRILNEESLKSAAENFKKVITEEFLDNIFNSIPKVWIYNLEDLIKLKEYILYRLNNIDYMVNMIINYNIIKGGV